MKNLRWCRRGEPLRLKIRSQRHVRWLRKACVARFPYALPRPWLRVRGCNPRTWSYQMAKPLDNGTPVKQSGNRCVKPPGKGEESKKRRSHFFETVRGGAFLQKGPSPQVYPYARLRSQNEIFPAKLEEEGLTEVPVCGILLKIYPKGSWAECLCACTLVSSLWSLFETCVCSGQGRCRRKPLHRRKLMSDRGASRGFFVWV